MLSLPSTGPSGSRERRLSAFARKHSGLANAHEGANVYASRESLDVVHDCAHPFLSHADVDGLEIFYREARPRDAPTVLLLHGFPSSHMFRNLIPMLADKYHVVAPDFPGYGESSAPSV